MDTNTYRCYARFYKINDVLYRQYLDIIREESKDSKDPVMIVVMLNPGSCKPPVNWREQPLIEVKPDATLYRIIGLLKYKNIPRARILNLSDIKQEKSKILFSEIKMKTQLDHYHHSIFCRPLNELADLVDNSMKVLFACGTNKASRELREKALEYFNDNAFTILNKNVEWYHPLMRPIKKDGKIIRDKWLNITAPHLPNNNA